jgi:hypothetical protein
MATKQKRPTEEARRDIQRGKDALADTVNLILDPTEPTKRDVARDKEFDALSVPKGGRMVRRMVVPARRYWPSANSQRPPTRPLGNRKSPR